MPHKLAGALEQTVGIRDLCPKEEPDVDVIPEGVDVSERRITDTRRRMAIMEQLSNIVSAAADDLEPAPSDSPKLARMFTHPGLDRWISFGPAGKPKKSDHREPAGAERVSCSRGLVGTVPRDWLLDRLNIVRRQSHLFRDSTEF